MLERFAGRGAVLRLLRQLGMRSSRDRPRSPRFVPDYDEGRLFAAIGSNVANGRAPGLKECVEAWTRRDADAARRCLAAHFLERAEPRFFVDMGELMRERTLDPEVREWRDATIADVRRWTETGLPLLAQLGPPLRPGFPWARATPDADHDLLFAVHPNRFQFLPRLAHATALGAYPAATLEALIGDWTMFSPRHPELSFCTNLVVAQRTVAVSWAIAFLRANPRNAAGACFRLIRVLAQDIAYLWPRLGDSYPNNHLLVDRFIACYIGLVFPELVPPDVDLSALETTWWSELERQTFDDGSGFEHSSHYHALGAEMAAAYLLLADANRRSVPDAVRTRIARMLELQAMLLGPEGSAPSIGDSSDDPMFPLTAPGRSGALRELFRSLFDARIAALRRGHPAREGAYWLLGGKLSANPDRPSEPSMLEYPQGGLAILSEDPRGTRLVLRTGPIEGTRFHPGHMHDDALSITLVVDGVPMLVDSGTCTYRYRQGTDGVNWRDYFAGRRAHNGLVVGAGYPSRHLRGDFRSDWSLARTTHIASAAGTALSFVEARGSGATSTPQTVRGVIHLRKSGFLVYDIVECLSSGEPAKFGFQWAPECEVENTASGVVGARDGRFVRITMSSGLGPATQVAGRISPPNGWVSRRYGERVAAPQSMVPVPPSGFTAFAIDCEQSDSAQSIDCAQPTAGSRAFRIERTSCCDIVLVNTDDPTGTVTGFGCVFSGRIAWLRIPRSGEPRLRWLEGASFECGAVNMRHVTAAAVRELTV